MISIMSRYFRPAVSIKKSSPRLPLARQTHSSGADLLGSNAVKLAYTSYESTNPENISPDSPIVILHGLLGSRSNWGSLAKAIQSKTGRKVITLDARNHGESPHSEEMTYKALATDVLELLKNLDIPRATLIGHSMGGRAMMKVSLLEPAAVDSLIVVDISPVNVSPSFHQLKKYLDAMQKTVVEKGVPRSTARKQAEKQLECVVQDYFVRQFLLTNLIENSDGSYKWRVNLDTIQRSIENIAGHFPINRKTYSGPTIFIGGEKSDYVRREDHELIRQMFPLAEFEYVKNAGHWVHAERPADFLDVVLKFLRKNH